MKKKSRRPKPGRTQTAESISEEEKRPAGTRGRQRKAVPETAGSFYLDNAVKHKPAKLELGVTAAADDTQKHPESKSKLSGESSRLVL